MDDEERKAEEFEREADAWAVTAEGHLRLIGAARCTLVNDDEGFMALWPDDPAERNAFIELAYQVARTNSDEYLAKVQRDLVESLRRPPER